MRMCWSKRYSGSEMMGVSLKKQAMVISTRACQSDWSTHVAPPACFYLNLVAKRNLYRSLRVLHVLSLQRFNCFCERWANRYRVDSLFFSWQSISAWASQSLQDKLTLQAAGMVLHKELGPGFCQQCCDAIHDLYPPFRCTVWIWWEMSQYCDSALKQTTT